MSRRANGEGSIYADKERGGYRGSIVLGGKRHSRRGRTKTAVRAKLDKLAADHRAGLAAHDTTTVADWMKVFLENVEHRVRKNGLKRNTADTYADNVRLRIDPHLGDKVLRDLGPQDLEVWHDIMLRTVGHATAAQAHRTLSAALTLAAQRGHVAANVARLVSAPSKPDDPEDEDEDDDILTSIQVHALVEAAARSGRLDLSPARILLGALSGLRHGEICALRDSDFDQASKTLRIRWTLARPSFRHGMACDGHPCAGKDCFGRPCPGRDCEPGDGAHACQVLKQWNRKNLEEKRDCFFRPCKPHTPGRCPTRQDGPIVTPPKSRASRRVINLPPPVVFALHEQLTAVREARKALGSRWADRTNDWLFPGTLGERPTIRGDARRWAELVREALESDAPTGTHAARRHAATRYAEAGIPVAEAMRHFGWTKADLALRYYVRISEQFAADAANKAWADWGTPVVPSVRQEAV